MVKTFLYEQLPPELLTLITGLKEEIADLKKLIQEGGENMAVSEAEFNQAKERIAKAETTLAQIQETVEQLNLQVGNITTLSEQVTALTEKIGEMDSYQTNNSQTVSNLQTQLTTIELNHANLAVKELTIPLFAEGDISLPLVDEYGSKITWSSSNPDVINENGLLLQRPSALQGNMNITMTATLTYGESSITKSFIVTVKAKEVTEGEKLEAALRQLDTSIFIGSVGDDIVYISENQTLPEDVDGYAITWVSSNETYLTADGTVVRPTDEDVLLTLKGTISSGLESKEVIFTITVLKEDTVIDPEPTPDPEPEPEPTDPPEEVEPIE